MVCNFCHITRLVIEYMNGSKEIGSLIDFCPHFARCYVAKCLKSLKHLLVF